jgi:N-acetylmuramoyl-L-alanine amidase CwlA
MKKNHLIAILMTTMLISFVSCNNSGTTSKSSSKQTDTSAMMQVMAADTTYTCTMHQNVMSDKPGKCPKCGMSLVKQKMTDDQKKMMKEGMYTKPKE